VNDKRLIFRSTLTTVTPTPFDGCVDFVNGSLFPEIGNIGKLILCADFLQPILDDPNISFGPLVIGTNLFKGWLNRVATGVRVGRQIVYPADDGIPLSSLKYTAH
jgi:hypothetical protein